MLDVDELFFDSSIQMTLIDPYPERLLRFLSDADQRGMRRGKESSGSAASPFLA